MSSHDWQPTASLLALQRRAQLLTEVRAFFAERQVLEVETPALARHATTDPQIESLAVHDPQSALCGYLQPSPEYAMKRLLASGSGDIFQICRVYRAGERRQLICVHHYPASQAALAQLDQHDPRTALRFELYAEGIELANGYVELGDAELQRQRFAHDAQERARRGLVAHAGDPRLLAALRAGLPSCAGVALGLDRVLMLALGVQHIDAVLALPLERA